MPQKLPRRSRSSDRSPRLASAQLPEPSSHAISSSFTARCQPSCPKAKFLWLLHLRLISGPLILGALRSVGDGKSGLLRTSVRTTLGVSPRGSASQTQESTYALRQFISLALAPLARPFDPRTPRKPGAPQRAADRSSQ